MIIMLMVSVFASVASAGIQADRQQSMLDQQLDFNSEEAQIAREYLSEPERYNRLVQLGANPDLALSSIMGNPQTSSFSAGSPGQVMPSDISSLSNLFGGFTDRMLTEQLNAAQIDNLNSNTTGQDIENGFLPLTLSAQVDYLGAWTDAKVKDGFMSEAMADYYREQIPWVAPLSASECALNYSRVTEAFAAADKFWAEAETQEHLQGLYDSEKALNWQSVKESIQRTKNLEKEGESLDILAETAAYERDETWAQSVMSLYDQEWRSKMDGAPFTGDVMLDLFFMRSTDEGKEFSEKFIKEYFEGSRSLYDYDMQNKMDHWLDQFLLKLGANDVLDAGSTLGGAAIIRGGKAGFVPSGMQTTPKATPHGLKPGKFKSEVRVDSNGKRWKSYQTVDGSVKWLPESHFN